MDELEGECLGTHASFAKKLGALRHLLDQIHDYALQFMAACVRHFLHVFMVEYASLDAGARVGNAADAHHFYAEIAQRNSFVNRAHSDGMCPQTGQHAYLGRGFVTGAEQTGINTFSHFH